MSETSFGPADLQEYMVIHGIPGEILLLQAPTPTVESAAQAVGTQPENIVKSILFTINHEPVLAIACGLSQIDRRVLADLYAVGRKKVKLADPATVLAISGFEVGAMPPFGHKQPLITLLDPRVMAQTVVYAGGGGENALLKVDPKEILRVTNARLVGLTGAVEAPGP